MFGKLGSAIAARLSREPATRLALIERALAKGFSEATFTELKALAQEGYAPAQYRVGQLYETAAGVVQSLPDAVAWYTKAATQGDLKSQERLGLIYFIETPAVAAVSAESAADGSAGETAPLTGPLAQFFPLGVSVRQNYAEALKWNHLAAEAGSAEAPARLGHQLALGLGTDPEPDAAERCFAAAAAQGSVEGQLGLGLLYAGNYDTPPNLPLAAQWLGVAAEAGNKIAQYGWAKLALHGEGTARDAAGAIRALKKAAAADYVPAMYLLGMVYWQGEGVPVDVERGETWLRRASVRGHGLASNALAQLLLERPEDDGAEAANILRDQAEAGDVRAAATLAELYTFGRGVPRDVGEATRWRERAAAEQRPESLIMLASLHAEGISVPEDYAVAAELLREAAERGSVEALYNLGSLYRFGKGVPLDLKRAAQYYREAAKRGSTEAAFQLGLLLAEAGDEAKHEAAAACFAAAAKSGHVGARANLGLMLAEGVGVTRNPDLALSMLEDAANSGDPAAQTALGFQLAGGLLGASDLEAARPWFEKAAAGGDADAAAWLGDVHRLGLLGEVDYGRAEEWYRRAAGAGHVGAIVLLATAIDAIENPTPEQQAESFGLWLAAASSGDVVAQTRVGQAYRLGRGCGEPDVETARVWLRRAYEGGSTEAFVALEMLAAAEKRAG